MRPDFAISKDTLVFAGTRYTNNEKNVPIPDSEYAYIVNGVILPIDKCYMGMSRDEVEKALDPLTVEHEKTWSTCELPEEYGNVTIEFSFHDEFGLKEIKYRLNDYYDEKADIIDILSDMYGDYDEGKWSSNDNSIEEAASYFRIGENKLRRLINENPDADYILWNGTRAQIKRKKFEEIIDKLSAI